MEWVYKLIYNQERFTNFNHHFQGVNYKLTNRVSAQQQENELVMRLNNTRINENKRIMTSANVESNPIDIAKPKIDTWSEFSRQTQPLPYW